MAVKGLHVHQHQVDVLAAEGFGFKGVPDGLDQEKALVRREPLGKKLLDIGVIFHQDRVDHSSSSFVER